MSRYIIGSQVVILSALRSVHDQVSRSGWGQISHRLLVEYSKTSPNSWPNCAPKKALNRPFSSSLLH